MHPPGADTVVVRHGDVGVKSPPVQRRMELVLRENLLAMLEVRGIAGSVDRQWGRLLVRVDESDVEAATDAATDTFGVVSASPTTSTRPTKDAIFETLVETGREWYTDGTFAVRARRAGQPEAHPFSSHDLEREGGAAIWEDSETRFEPAVDLDDPDVTFFVECRCEEAFVFLEKRPGPGGFPLGTQGRAVAMLSGGFDSPVAAWEIMKRGVEITPIYFDFGDYGGVDHVARAVEIGRALARQAPGKAMTLRIVPAGEAADLLVREVEKTRMLSLRRFMFAVAEQIAREEHAHGIVTGEALGQKSSQTGPNLAVTDAATELPIYRPLLTRDKQAIIAQAKAIGTHVDSTIDAGCNRIAPTQPATNATVEAVASAEPDELDVIVERAVDAVERVDLTLTPKP